MDRLRTELAESRWADAAATLSGLSRHYPARFAEPELQLSAAYVALKLGQPGRAAALASRWTDHPAADTAGYARYLQAAALLTDPASSSARQEQAKDQLRALATAGGRYADAAGEVLQQWIDQRAERELVAARQMWDSGDAAGAVNRARYLVERYPDSRHVPAALALMASGYRALGLEELARAAEGMVRP